MLASPIEKWLSFLWLSSFWLFLSPVNLNAQKDYKDIIIKIEALSNATLFDSAAVLVEKELRPLLNSSDCNGETITLYPSGIFDFFLIESNEGAVLYFENTYYCNHTPTYDCIAAYILCLESSPFGNSIFFTQNNLQ